MVWTQNYDPLHNPTLSTLLAAAPLVVLLGAIAILRIRAHFAALGGLVDCLRAIPDSGSFFRIS